MGNLRQRHAVGSDRCVTRAAEAQAHAEARWRHSLGAKARLSIKGPAQAKSRYKSKGMGEPLWRRAAAQRTLARSERCRRVRVAQELPQCSFANPQLMLYRPDQSLSESSIGFLAASSLRRFLAVARDSRSLRSGQVVRKHGIASFSSPRQ